MDQVNDGSESGEEDGFFTRRVAAADDTDWQVAVEGTVAGCAGCEAATDERFFAFEAEVTRGGATGDDEGAGFSPRTVDEEAGIVAHVFEVLDLGEFEARAEPLGLFVHALDEFGAIHAVWEAWKIFDSGGGGELATREAAFEDERVESGSGGVDGGGETCATSSNNGDVFHGVEIN